MIRFALFYCAFWGTVFGLFLCCSVTEPPPAMSREDSTRALQRQLQRALDSARCADLDEPCPPGGPQ